MGEIMKAAVYARYGPPEVLRIVEVEKPVPFESEVLIRVCATTVSSGDSRLRRADPFVVRLVNGPTQPKRWPILGAELAGIVEAVGPTVTRFKEGDEVFGSTGMEMGANAEYKCLSQDGVLALKPANLSFEEAAAIPFGALASLHFLRAGNVGAGKKVLIYGASGSLGVYAVQLAKHFGAEVTGVCSTANLELVTSLGADKTIDYTQEDFSGSGETYDAIFDTTGKSPFTASVRSLKDDGVYLRSVHISPGPLLRGLWTSMTTRKKVIGGVASESAEDIEFLKTLIESGVLQPVIDRRYRLEQIVEAHRYVDTGHKKGSVVVTLA